jgi:uncharacterized protein YbcV (DUF1398 family)
MFTLDQIKAAHSKVKSGADFPAYIREIKQLGVQGYEAYVMDGHVNYFGMNNFAISSPSKYESLEIAPESDALEFKKGLLDHQQGNTDYMTFCTMSAKTGVEKWVVDLLHLTCSYYNQAGDLMLVESIPQ